MAAPEPGGRRGGRGPRSERGPRSARARPACAAPPRAGCPRLGPGPRAVRPARPRAGAALAARRPATVASARGTSGFPSRPRTRGPPPGDARTVPPASLGAARRLPRARLGRPLGRSAPEPRTGPEPPSWRLWLEEGRSAPSAQWPSLGRPGPVCPPAFLASCVPPAPETCGAVRRARCPRGDVRRARPPGASAWLGRRPSGRETLPTRVVGARGRRVLGALGGGRAAPRPTPRPTRMAPRGVGRTRAASGPGDGFCVLSP